MRLHGRRTEARSGAVSNTAVSRKAPVGWTTGRRSCSLRCAGCDFPRPARYSRDSRDSLRSSLTPLAAVLASSGFVQPTAPFSPPGSEADESGTERGGPTCGTRRSKRCREHAVSDRSAQRETRRVSLAAGRGLSETRSGQRRSHSQRRHGMTVETQALSSDHSDPGDAGPWGSGILSAWGALDPSSTLGGPIHGSFSTYSRVDDPVLQGRRSTAHREGAFDTVLSAASAHSTGDGRTGGRRRRARLRRG